MSQIFTSKLNSTNVVLSSNSTFVGTSENVSNWEEIDIIISGTPSNAAGEFYFEFSPNGTNWDISIPFIMSGPNLTPITLRVLSEWFRVRYVNGSTPLTSFRLNTVFHRTSSMRLTRFLSQSIDPNEPVELVKVAKSVLPDGAATESTLATISNLLTGTLQVTGSVVIEQQANVTGSTFITTTGSNGLLVSFGNTPPTINSTTVTTGNLGLAVGNAASQPLFVTDSTVPNQTDVNYDLSSSDTWYYGYAVLGSSNSAPVWTIKRVTVVAGNPTSTRWSPTGSVWDNRTALSYT